MPADAELDKTLQTLASNRFGPLSEAERKLLAALPTGREANCSPDGLAGDAPENDPARADAWDHDRTIRAALLAWLCIDTQATAQIHHLGIRLTGARIDDVFDLSFAKVPFRLWFHACSVPLGVRLRGTAIPELRLPRCRIGPLLPHEEGRKTAIMAAGLRVQNTVFLSDGFHADGEVSLRDSDIGLLECSGGKFKNTDGRALYPTRAKIGGPVFLSRHFQAEGEVCLVDANIGGLACSGDSSFRNTKGPALNAERAKIGGAVLLGGDFHAEGEVCLRNADIGGLECAGGASFKNTKGPALNAEGAKVSGPVFLRNGFSAEGEVILADTTIGGLECAGGASFKNTKGPALNATRAKIDGPVFLRNGFAVEGEVILADTNIGGLACSGRASFKNTKGPALNAERAKIGGPVFLRNGFAVEGGIRLLGATVSGNVDIEAGRSAGMDGIPTFGLNLHGARIDGTLDMQSLRCASDTVVILTDTSCDVLVDATTSWPYAENLKLDGFVYRRLRDPFTPLIRLDWLRRELPSDERKRRGRFQPQPYRQLAGVLREQGFDAEAKKVLIGMAQDRRRWAKLGMLSRFWQLILWITIRNGHQPMRAGLWLLILWLVGFPAFGLGYQMQVMVPSERFAYDGFAQGVLPGYYAPFCALVYSIDTSLPIIGFGQKDRWHPRQVENPSPQASNDGVSGFLCKADFTRLLDPNSLWVSRAMLATCLEVYRWFHLAFGWFLATMLLAGISGLVGRE